MQRRLALFLMVALAAFAQDQFPNGPYQPPNGPPSGAPNGAPNGVSNGPQNGSAENDPPGRAARLSYVAGTVSFQPGSVEDWIPATLNRPMTTGDRLWTETGARAEMHTGSAAFRLNGHTSFAFLNLDDRTAQVQ